MTSSPLKASRVKSLHIEQQLCQDILPGTQPGLVMMMMMMMMKVITTYLGQITTMVTQHCIASKVTTIVLGFYKLGKEKRCECY